MSVRLDAVPDGHKWGMGLDDGDDDDDWTNRPVHRWHPHEDYPDCADLRQHQIDHHHWPTATRTVPTKDDLAGFHQLMREERIWEAGERVRAGARWTVHQSCHCPLPCAMTTASPVPVRVQDRGVFDRRRHHPVPQATGMGEELLRPLVCLGASPPIDHH